MNKKKIITLNILGIISLTTMFIVINNNDNLVFSEDINITNDSCVTPSGYTELYDAIESANKEIGLTLNTNSSGSTTYKTLGTITRINKGSSKDDIYIERIDPHNRIRSGLYIYGVNTTNYEVGNLIGVTGTFTNYYGQVELIAKETELLANNNSYGDVNPTIISVNDLTNNYSYINQATLNRKNA